MRTELTHSREVYGISGNKGHGKDTFAKMIREVNETFVVNHFAGELKRQAGQIFHLTDGQLHDPALKEEFFKEPIEMDSFLEPMRKETGVLVQPRGKVAKNTREIMQFFGTEYVRGAQDNYWIERLLQDTAGDLRVLVPDTRFQNEANAIRSVGGKIIKVLRIDSLESIDGHVSETEIAGIVPDLLIGSITGDLSLPQRVATLIAKGDFESALQYDYRFALNAMEIYVPGLSAKDNPLRWKPNATIAYDLLRYYRG